MPPKGEIAIVGFACRVPGARDSGELWRLLSENRCAVSSSITADRFPTQPFFHPLPGQSGRSYTFAAGLIDDVWGFDAAAFGMSPREAEQVDPQHRHLLEVTYDALTHAGIRPSTLAGSETSVYVGASSVDYAARFFADPNMADVHMMTGNSLSIMANRISYALDLRGTSIALDTACSSSMVALHLAAEAIRQGTADTAIVGGVNLLLSPFSYVGFSRASMLSPTGLCRPFDAGADGYVRSEGTIVVILRSMNAARTARNTIHGVIVGSGINQDGRTTGLSLPSAASQRQLLERVYDEFCVDPSDLLFVEAHGTGTPVGDPIEADALGKGLAQRRSQPLPIGSVKSNIGHLEPVSGLAGLLKTIMALKHGMVPATLHQQSPNPNIDFTELNLKVIAENWSSSQRGAQPLAGVNSFGFGGTNAHAILRSDVAAGRVVHITNDAAPPPLILSAYTADALPAVAAASDLHWPDDARLAPDFIAAHAYQRDLLPHRALIRGITSSEIRRSAQRFAAGEKDVSVLTGHAFGTDLPIAFIFSGNGSQWAGMGRQAWTANEHFREALREIDDHFAKVQSWSIVTQLFDDDLEQKLRLATYSQPLLLALQVASVRVLEEMGVMPVSTLGHSVGEVSAAWAAGALSLDQAIEIVIARSRHQEATYRTGGMAALRLSESEARRFLKVVNAPGVEIAAVNSSRSVTISGPTTELNRVLQDADRLRVSARILDIDYPFHSSLVDAVRTPLLQDLEHLKPLPLRHRMISSVTGDAITSEMLGAEHWWRNVRDPVQFGTAVARLLEDGLRIFIEISPKSILASYVRETLRESAIRGAAIETMGDTNAQDAVDPLGAAAAKVLLAGGSIDQRRFFGAPPSTGIVLPLYPWQHTPFLVQPTIEASTMMSPASHPLLGRRFRLDCSEWFSTIDPALFPWLDDHKVANVAVFPATAYVEIMLAAARETYPDSGLELRDMDILQPLIFDRSASFETLLRLSPETGLAEFLSRARGGVPDWTLHARGVIGRSTVVGKVAPAPEEPLGTILIAKSRVYEWASRLGFEYGPAFQRARHVYFPHPKRAITRLEPPSAGAFGSYVSDLTAFDTAFHALFASEEGGVADMPMKRMLPVHFDSVRVLSPGATAELAVARTIRQSLTSIVVDIELYDRGGILILTAENVRLIEAGADAAADARSLTCHMSSWQLDRAGRKTLSAPIPIAEKTNNPEYAVLGEALFLIEAGCLRSVWAALAGRGNAGSAPARHDRDAPDWAPFLYSALLWHLASRGIAVERGGQMELASDCELPDVSSIVASLASRHPTMVAETVSLARIEEIVDGIVGADPTVEAEFSTIHWRQLNVASNQIRVLRDEILADTKNTIKLFSSTQLLRGLMIGATHVDAAVMLTEQFPNLEITVAELESNRLEQARLLLSDDHPRIRCVPWSIVEGLASDAIDFALAIDGLSDVAAMEDGLVHIARALRPAAPILAAEPAPSIFWDIVRGTRPRWWARSANSEFPVGALLTGQEWIDEFRVAGFRGVAVTPVMNDARIGVTIRALADKEAEASSTAEEGAVDFLLDGDKPRDGTLTRHLLRRLADGNAKAPPANTDDRSPATDVIWLIDMSASSIDESEVLARHLDGLANCCRRLAANPARLWVLADFGRTSIEGAPLALPIWCAITAAMRVAQNEYAGLQVRSLGWAGSTSKLAQPLADEILNPDDEREIFLDGASRFVFRVHPGSGAPVAAPLSEDTAMVLAARKGQLALGWRAEPRREPNAGEVEIEVAATGLNFRDVMWNLRLLPEEALEDGYAGLGLGMECAGSVLRVGKGASAFQVGDRVVGFAPHAFASHVIASTFAISPLPADVTFEAACSIPVAFLTAYYSLVHLGQLRSGQTVLIHGGGGAVGLAAIQIARRCGAKIIATAGSTEKRAFLRKLGVDFVCNSRDLSFADEITTFTEGKGVDVVLNSLAGQAMARSIDCLCPFGRFIELGKRDFYANTFVGLRPLRRNLSYFGVDIDQLLGEHKELAQTLFSQLLDLFANEELFPLPYRVFDADNVADAFRLMQRAGHIGKIVVRPPTEASNTPMSFGKFPVDTDAIHIIVGGTSGFGLHTATWLADRGATRIILASRTAQLSDADLAKVQSLRDRDVEVLVERVDVGNEAAIAAFIRDAKARGKIKGIVHAAMVIEDRLIEGMDMDAIETVMRPKVAGALNLERIAVTLHLDYLLLYSSATTMFGNPGQYNYVAANAFLEGLARRMQSNGVPALAIAWGGIADAGYLSRNITSDTNLKKRFAANLITARTALDGLDWLYNDSGRQLIGSCAIALIDWAVAKRELAAVRTQTFAAIGASPSARTTMEGAALIERLRALGPEEALDALVDIIVEEIARVLRLSTKEVDRHRPLAEIGMDSLMMLELRGSVEQSIGIDLPLMSLSSGIAPVDVARRIAPLLVGEGESTVPRMVVALTTSHLAVEAETMGIDQHNAAIRAVLERVRELEEQK